MANKKFAEPWQKVPITFITSTSKKHERGLHHVLAESSADHDKHPVVSTDDVITFVQHSEWSHAGLIIDHLERQKATHRRLALPNKIVAHAIQKFTKAIVKVHNPEHIIFFGAPYHPKQARLLCELFADIRLVHVTGSDPEVEFEVNIKNAFHEFRKGHAQNTVELDATLPVRASAFEILNVAKLPSTVLNRWMSALDEVDTSHRVYERPRFQSVYGMNVTAFPPQGHRISSTRHIPNHRVVAAHFSGLHHKMARMDTP